MNQPTIRKSDLRTELLRQLAQAVERRDTAGGLRLAEKAIDAMTDREDPRAGKIRCLEAQLHYISGNYRKALASSRLAAAMLSPFGESEELAATFLLTGKTLIGLGNYREAETAFLDAESLYRRNDNNEGRIDAANQLARVYFIRAEYKNALKYLLDAIRLADHAGNRRMLAFLWGNLGRVHTLMGNFRKAADALDVNIEISAELGDEKEKAKALLSRGYLEMITEKYDSAEKHFDEAYLILLREKMQREVIICQTYYGELNLRRGDNGPARRYLNEAIDGARRMAPESSLMVTPLRHLAELELAESNHGAASRLANQALAIAERIKEAVETGALCRILARLAAGHNKDRAAELFARAISVFDETGARVEKAETMVAMATSNLYTRQRNLVNLFRAADIYNRLGMTSRHDAVQEMINHVDIADEKSQSSEMHRGTDLPLIITANLRLKRIIGQIEQAAHAELPVLLCGETGTGKDLIARYYHHLTGRKGEFVPVNCAAFPETLLEAELFGYRKGAFTGAEHDKEGLLHRANGGTFFLDEIGEMPLASQAKLLTVIETCKARRLGETIEETLDIRFVAATNRDLTRMVGDGGFRRDLYFRLCGISFELPPLAERPEDIPLLLHYFLRREGIIDENDAVDPQLISEFSVRSWPGNVRQLESEVKKLALFRNIARDDSLGEMAGVLAVEENDRETTSLVDQVEQFEKALIIRALRQADGNKSRAARSLSIHESTLRAKMKRYELNLEAIS